MFEALVGLTLTLIGAVCGIYPAYDKAENRIAKAEAKRVKGHTEDMDWVKEHFREHIIKPRIPDPAYYAVSFALIAIGSVLLAWPQLVS
jgi:hypothetical protein